MVNQVMCSVAAMALAAVASSNVLAAEIVYPGPNIVITINVVYNDPNWEYTIDPPGDILEFQGDLIFDGNRLETKSAQLTGMNGFDVVGFEFGPSGRIDDVHGSHPVGVRSDNGIDLFTVSLTALDSDPVAPTLDFVGNGNDFFVVRDLNDHVVTVPFIPEPSTAILFVLGIFGFLGLRTSYRKLNDTPKLVPVVVTRHLPFQITR